jgi:adenosyl cobinamide kinase/adenosyl cobinamide phosphate guanylyltransferase
MMRDLIAWVQALVKQPAPLPSYRAADLPDAAQWFSTAARDGRSAMIFVSDEVGGAVPAFTDGMNWRRVTDRNVVS